MATVFMPRPDPSARGLFTPDEYAQMRAFFAARPALGATPLRDLPGLAARLGIGHLVAKDETGRFGLNAFKLLGARFAIETLVAGGEVRRGHTLVCASEGNHGRAVARAAREAGCAARVYMAHDVARARVDAIAGEGATVVTVDGSYDDAVRISEADARAHGWTVISDTAWEGYERIPRLIMLGYTRMMDEAYGDQGSGTGDQGSGNGDQGTGNGDQGSGTRDQGSGSGGHRDPDLILVQGGVGGLLCGVASWWAFHRPARRPRIVCVEPTSAACLQASAWAGAPVAVTGPLTTTMGGLRNREVSPLAFHAVLPIVDAFMAIDDAWTFEAMRAYAAPAAGDPAIGAGASGAATLGGLLALLGAPVGSDFVGANSSSPGHGSEPVGAEPVGANFSSPSHGAEPVGANFSSPSHELERFRRQLGLNRESRVLAIISEGVTDPALWASHVRTPPPHGAGTFGP